MPDPAPQESAGEPLADSETETTQEFAGPGPAATDNPAPQMGSAPSARIDDMRGMSADQVIALLGTPQFRRSEATAQIWHYRNEACVLYLFLYRSDGGLKVHHAEAHPRAGSGRTIPGPAANACLAKLTAARASPTG